MLQCQLFNALRPNSVPLECPLKEGFVSGREGFVPESTVSSMASQIEATEEQIEATADVGASIADNLKYDIQIVNDKIMEQKQILILLQLK